MKDFASEEDGNQLRKTLGLPESAFVLIYPAEFSKRKSQHVLIEAMQGGAAGGLVVLPTLRVYGEDGEYTPELLEIYGKNRVES